MLAVVGRLAACNRSRRLHRQGGRCRWLGREGLDENELEFFLTKPQALVMPNNEERVQSFFLAVCSDRRHPAVVPLWACRPGSLGKHLTSDPLQRIVPGGIPTKWKFFVASDSKIIPADGPKWSSIIGRAGVPCRSNIPRTK
ncbi:hypothetical protein ACJ41O_010829 [Fusarium nematophilum]